VCPNKQIKLNEYTFRINTLFFVLVTIFTHCTAKNNLGCLSQKYTKFNLSSEYLMDVTCSLTFFEETDHDLLESY